ncbi:MAG: hypothetical protein ACREIU_03115, partial [Planctomycetota bacterium]
VEGRWRAQVARATVRRRVGGRPSRIPPLAFEVLLGARDALPGHEFERLAFEAFFHIAPEPQFTRPEGPVEFLGALLERPLPSPEERMLLALTALTRDALVAGDPARSLGLVLAAPGFSPLDQRELCRRVTDRDFLLRKPRIPREGTRPSSAAVLEPSGREASGDDAFFFYDHSLISLAYERFLELGGDLDPLARAHLDWGRETRRWQWRATTLFSLLERRPDLAGPAADRILSAAAAARDLEVRLRALERIAAARGPEVAARAASPKWRDRKPWLRPVFSWEWDERSAGQRGLFEEEKAGGGARGV